MTDLRFWPDYSVAQLARRQETHATKEFGPIGHCKDVARTNYCCATSIEDGKARTQEVQRREAIPSGADHACLFFVFFHDLLLQLFLVRLDVAFPRLHGLLVANPDFFSNLADQTKIV